jgi:hypothetical protein
VRIELVFQGLLPAKHSFQGGEKLILFQMGLYSYIQETHVPLKRKPSVLEAQEHLAHVFPVRIRLVFERNTACQSHFQGGDRLCLVKICLYS